MLEAVYIDRMHMVKVRKGIKKKGIIPKLIQISDN